LSVFFLTKRIIIMKSFEKLIERLIFTSRWLQVPMYLGLIIATLLYTYKFIEELFHLAIHITHIEETALMLGVLSLVDIVMVANLLIMVIMGGYSTFVSNLHIDSEEDRPAWLDKVDAGSMKAKLAASLVSISAIHLLRSFMDISNKSEEHVKWQVVIHMVFLVSALSLAWTEKVMHSIHPPKEHGGH
jgi:uncharacterized protein (TIGR00645 family)